MSANRHTLTIEYVDDLGQLQRTEHLEGSQFTLRVQSGALAVVGGDAQASAAAHTAAVHSAPSPLVTKATHWRDKPVWLWALMLYGAYAAIAAVQLWITHNPDKETQNYVAMALLTTGGIALWSGFWAMLSKIFAKDSRYLHHVCAVLLMAICMSSLVALMHFLSFSLSWHVLGRMDVLVIGAAFGVLLWCHLRHIVSPAGYGKLQLVMLSLTATCISLIMWGNHRRHDSVLDTLHSPYIYQPALQLARPVSSEAFFQEAAALEGQLKSKAAQSEPGEDSLDDGGDWD